MSSQETSHRKRQPPFGQTLALLLLLVAFLLSGCGDSPKSESARPEGGQAVSTEASKPGNSIDPCNLITKAEVEAVINTKVIEKNKGQIGPTSFACSYKPEDSTITDWRSSIYVTISSQRAQPYEFKAEVDSAQIGLDTTAVKIEGLGDEAYSIGNEFLFVLKKGTSFNLYFPQAHSDAGAIEKGKVLAAKGLEKL